MLVVVSPLIVYSQNISDSLATDTLRYWFSELEVKTFIKTKVDLNACNSVLIKKDSIILAEREKQLELKKQVDNAIAQTKIEQKKAKKLKWGVGTAGVIVGGLIIYAIVRK